MEAATSTRLMALLDRDGNGEVDFNEFLAMHKRLPAKI
jgi:Ca2+-binding EF-hand superfamily protein